MKAVLKNGVHCRVNHILVETDSGKKGQIYLENRANGLNLFFSGNQSNFVYAHERANSIATALTEGIEKDLSTKEIKRVEKQVREGKSPATAGPLAEVLRDVANGHSRSAEKEQAIASIKEAVKSLSDEEIDKAVAEGKVEDVHDL